MSIYVKEGVASVLIVRNLANISVLIHIVGRNADKFAVNACKIVIEDVSIINVLRNAMNYVIYILVIKIADRILYVDILVLEYAVKDVHNYVDYAIRTTQYLSHFLGTKTLYLRDILFSKIVVIFSNCLASINVFYSKWKIENLYNI